MTARELIIQTKLQPPQAKGRIISRERLLGRLQENFDKKLIIVCAGAGYGKTTLLAQLCADLKVPFVFYHLEPSDHDIATFFNYIATGIAQRYPGFGERTRRILPQTRDISIIVGTFINELIEKIHKEFYIILDDFHCVQHNRELAQALDYLLHHMPANAHLVIASRTTPNLNLDHYLAKQELFKLDKEELQFDLEEIQFLLKEAYGLDMPEAEIRLIEKHSEGWVTAIQLILQKICAAGEGKTMETLNGYIASGEEIFSYFAREVFFSQPYNIREFLMQTSILDFLNAAICNYLLDTRKSKEMLACLEIEHIFVSKVGGNFRYHPLFQEFLLKRFNDYYPKKRLRELHAKMGRYFVGQKDYSAAVNHFLLSERYGRAAEILAANYLSWRLNGALLTFLFLVERFPEAVIQKYPHLLLRKARALLYLGRYDVLIKLAQGLIGQFRRQSHARGRAESLFLVGYANILLNNPKVALGFMKRGLRLVAGERSRLEAEILIGLCTNYRVLDQYGKAERAMKEVLELVRRLKDAMLQITVLKSLANLYWAKSDYKKADEVFDRIIADFSEYRHNLDFAKIYSDASQIALLNNDVAKALEDIKAAERIAEQFNDRRAVAYILSCRAGVYQYVGDYRKAIAFHEKALEANKERKERLQDIYNLSSIVLNYCRLGDPNAARQTLQKIEPLVAPRDAPQTFFDYIMSKVDIEMADGKYRLARQYLGRALSMARRSHQVFQEMIVGYRMGAYCLRTGKVGEAMKWLHRSIRIARENKYHAFFIEEGRYDLDPIARAVDNGIDVDYLTVILNMIDNDKARQLIKKLSMKRGNYSFGVRCFGLLELSDQGGRPIPLAWRTKKTKSLFAYLVLNQAKGCTKDQLIDAFWPNKPLAEAAHSLQVEVSHIRKLLKSVVRSDVPARDLIDFQNQRYYVNQELLIRTDVGEFEKLSAEGDEPRDGPAAVKRYEQSLTLYRDDFCVDIADEWCESKRRYYRDVVRRMLKQLGKVYYEQKSGKRSLEYYQRALEFDAYDESVHIGLMACYELLGDRNAVQAQYQTLIKKLNEVGITAPSPEAVRAYKRSFTTE